MYSDLDTEATITILLSDAHMGGTRVLQVDDEKIEVKVPPGIRNGQRLRVKGKGNRQVGTDRRGDLYLRIAILNEVKVEDVTNTRDTSYRNRGAGARESFLTAQPSEARRDTTYRNSGAGLVEAVLGIDKPRDTTYRNSGAGNQDRVGKTQGTKRTTSRPNSTSYAHSQNIQEYIFWTDKSAFFYGKITEWKEGRGNGFYAKNDIVCEIRCFTPDARPPFTEYIKAACDMVVTERLTVQGQQIPNSCPLFRYTLQSIQRSNQQSSPRTTNARHESAQSNQISEPIEGLDNLIEIVRHGYAFQVRDVLERIINTERERMENERLLWRLGAGAVTLATGGFIDGFGIDDLLSGMAMSNVAGMAHQFASKEQVEFLKKLQSEWLVLDRSPMDIRRRLGEPQGRFIGISRSNILDMFNIHQSGSRGFHMVELDYAGNVAKGFKDAQSLEVLQRSYDEEDIGIISTQLYPSNITPLKLCRTITPEEAKKKDPYYNQLSKAGAPFRVVYSDDTEGIMYKIQIPHHSDY